jgi:hypothetical protein
MRTSSFSHISVAEDAGEEEMLGPIGNTPTTRKNPKRRNFHLFAWIFVFILLQGNF